MRIPWFRRGPIDPVAEQLDEIESRGRSTIWLAHVAAFLVLVVFSLGSLVGLTGDSLNALLSQWRASHATNITAAIAIGVSTLLVFAMDIGMYYAAMRVRVMKRRGQGDSVRLDWAVIIGVGVVEALSYAYMSYLYDHPQGVIWALIILRAAAAPMLAAYLSLAETSPVGERDIVQSVERVVAHGVITEMTHIAGDITATLERKLALYKGARGGLDALIQAETATRGAAPPALNPPLEQRIGIAAHPTSQLMRPDSGPVNAPDEGDPDDDGPGGGVPATYDPWGTEEYPAIALSANGHSRHNPGEWSAVQADGPTDGLGEDEGPDDLRTGRKRPAMTRVEREAYSVGKEAMRLQHVRAMLQDTPDLKPRGARTRLRKLGLGTNDDEAARLLRVARGEEAPRWERVAAKAHDQNRFRARAVGAE